MKKNIHPEYQDVLFVDSASGHKFVCGSSLKTKETAQFQGKTYPVCRVSISSSSHPLFTGDSRPVDSAGRVESFNRRFGAKKNAPAVATAQKEEKQAAPKATGSVAGAKANANKSAPKEKKGDASAKVKK